MITLRGASLLEMLSDEATRQLLAIGQRETYPDGALIQSRGDPSPSMAVVLEGKVRICRISSAGHETLVSIIDKDQHWGDGLMFGGTHLRHHDALAEGDVVLARFDADAFAQVLELHDVVKTLYEINARRLILQLEFQDDLRSLPADVLVAKFLLFLWDQRKNDGPLGFAQGDLASVLGLSNMTTAKALATLRTKGFIETGYRQLQIVDRQNLRDWVVANI